MQKSIILLLSIFVCIINLSQGLYFRKYPLSYIKKSETPEIISYKFPHINTRFCKSFITPKNNVKIIARYPFYLNIDIPVLDNIDIDSINMANNVGYMELNLPKKPDNNQTIVVTNDNPPILPSGIEIIDIDTQEYYPKDSDASYGYFNMQNVWVNY